MPKLSLLVSTFSLALLLPIVTADAAQDRSSQVDSIFKPLVASDSPGFAVGVVRNGKPVFSRGYGLADLNTKRAITPATNFRLASVTKQFTAMAVMLLVHDGKLRYDDSLTKVLPEFPSCGSRITIRNLLNHTSGLKHYEDIYQQQTPNIPPDKVPQLHDAAVLRLLEQQTAGDFAPGTRWEYSNSGYAVLAMIVERVSRKSFSSFLEQRIFAPLGMAHTVAYVKGSNQVSNRAFGYRKSPSGEGWTFSDQSPTSAVLGDGGIYSSIDDLAKWDNALAEHQLLNEAEMRPAITPVEVEGGVRLPDGSPSQYGFGWFLDPYKGHRRMWHYGDTSGFHTYIERLIDDKLTVIVLANRTDVDPREPASRIAELYLAADSR